MDRFALGAAAELGAVTDRGVRVWLRQPDRSRVTVLLETPGRPRLKAVTETSAERDWTGVVEMTLPEPAPDAPFVVTVGERRLRGRFAPDPAAHAGFAFGVASCHQPYGADDRGRIRLRAATRIYPAMRDDLLAAAARFLLLVGDQIYADAVPSMSVRDDLPGDAEHPPPPAVATDAYRRVTRLFFGEPGFRSVREALPTLCMWDDHDIFDNWGSRRRRTPLDDVLFGAAAQVFGEYQDARNPGGGERTPPYDFFIRFGTAGFLVLDLRGVREYEDGRLLGRAQWGRLHAFLKGREAARTQTLFVAMGVPIAHASRWFAALFAHAPRGYGSAVRDRWASPAFRASRDELLEELFAWQEGVPGRQAVVLAGDIHEADAVAIRRRGRPGTIWQFTSSAMTSPPHHRFDWLATRFPNLLERRFRFERRFLLARNNYGLVRLHARDGGGHDVRFEVRGWDPAARRLATIGVVEATPGDGYGLAESARACMNFDARFRTS